VGGDGTDYVLVSQVFPPAVGGSGILLHNVYSRVRGERVTALVDANTTAGGPLPQSGMEVFRTRIDANSWGLFTPSAWPNHLRLARRLYALAGRGRGVVHCGRAQPEGVPALLARLVWNGPPYLFWAHGEDISAALSSRQFAATMRMVYGHASAAIANSRNTADLLASTGWLQAAIHVVYPGVDAARFHPKADRGGLRATLAGPDEVLLLSVARLQKRKGHDLVLRAVDRLRRDMPKLRYVIVGDGAERMNLQQLARELRLESNVTFAGEVVDDVLPAYFAACDIFVLPTRLETYDFEGFGIVYLEAAAAGKPAIGGRNGGVPEAIQEGVTGMLVEGENVEELTAVLHTLCESRELRRRLGEAGRERATREFTWQRAADMVSAIHHDLAARR
jgi:phosphatidyl-myo-inositol dimannoside synthase